MLENNAAQTERKNPFFEPYNTPHDTVPFNRIEIGDYEEAFLEGIRRDDEEIEKLVNDPETPTFENTIVRVDNENGENYYDLLSRVSTVFSCMLSAETCDELDALAQKMSPILTKHANDVLPNAPGGDMTIRHTEEIADGVRVVHVTDGERCEESRERITGDAVVDKRLRRRQAKLGVYGLMKRRFGFAPPWGSLTGIRPTRLLYANLNKGMTMDEAVHELQRVFDVSDEKAAVLREIVQVQQALTLPARDEIDLYIGIPFCVSRCAYCSFLSASLFSAMRLRSDSISSSFGRFAAAVWTSVSIYCSS